MPQAPDWPDVMNIGGYSDAIFERIERFAREGHHAGNWVEAIEAVMIDGSRLRGRRERTDRRSAHWGFSERFKFPAAAQRPLQDFDRECLVDYRLDSRLRVRIPSAPLLFRYARGRSSNGRAGCLTSLCRGSFCFLPV